MMDWDKIKKQAKNITDKTIEVAGETLEKASAKKAEIDEQRRKNKSERQLRIETAGMFGKWLDIRRDKNDLYYFASSYSEDFPRFAFDGYEWGGANITTETNTKGDTETKGRTGQTLAGSIFGTKGAIIGASGKRKGKINTKSTSKEVEKNTIGILNFYDIENDEYKEIKFKNNRETDAKVRAFFR
jgi:hypothetical protein